MAVREMQGSADNYPTCIAELTAAYTGREISPVEVVETYLQRAEKSDPELFAYTSILRKDALAQAEAATAMIASGDVLPPLLGVPISIKDTLHIRGAISAFGSQVHRNDFAKTDSGVVARLRRAGAIFIGKTTTAEFAQSASTITRVGPPALNPWDLSRTSGGSSGGAAVSVAAGMAMVGIGTDGGGSIRMPAAFTGLFGFKPSLGLCQDEFGFRGMTPFSSPGPISRSVADAVRVVGVLAGRTLTPSANGPMRIAWCPDLGGRPAAPEVLAGVESVARSLAALGHSVEHVDVPVAGWEKIFAVLVLEEEHRERGHLLNVARDQLTGYMRASLERAAQLTIGDVEDARDRHRQFRHRFGHFMKNYDVVLTPTTAIPAFRLDDKPTAIAGTPIDRLWGPYPFTAPFNVAGACAATIPCGLVDGLPIGAQLASTAGRDLELLQLCSELESVLDPMPLLQ